MELIGTPTLVIDLDKAAVPEGKMTLPPSYMTGHILLRGDERYLVAEVEELSETRIRIHAEPLPN